MAYPKPLGEPAKRPQRGVPIASELIESLIRKHKGNISRAADALGCCRNTIQRRVNEEPALRQALEDERERFVDELEEACEDTCVRNEKDSALRVFMLKTRARKRGYEMTDNSNATQDIAKAAFDFVLNKSANPASPTQ